MGTPDSQQPGLDYTVVRSRRRTIALVVHADNRLEVRCGPRTPLKEIERFVLEKQSWIRRKYRENQDLIPVSPGTGPELTRLRQSTRHLVETIIAQHPDLKPQKITIRRQKSRWGSCSRRGTISINVCAGLLPPKLLEYIVVHELCHLSQFNHSARFYQLVCQKLPDARERQRQLKQFLLV
jgi:predicted metal-dependent hydrolase